MNVLAKQRKTHRNVLLPRPIDSRGLFALDVDDDIWQDSGLDEAEESVPAWLASENIREGIKALLNRDRCVEEEARIKKERAAMQHWINEEWVTLQQACADHSEC
jgi:TPP-dependent indolepyruvate ferredoxin oxidoreductase alpha subunit